MLCTRIRLCERRYNSISARETPEGGIISAATTTTTTSLSPSSLSTLPGSSLSSSARIIQRPCIIRNLTNNCGNNSSTNSAVVGGGTAGTGGVGASGNSVFNSSMTPRQIIEQSIAKKTIRKKPPLVVFSLGMPSGTKTLVQHNVKRDPRKLPIFCENYKQITKRSRNSNKISNEIQQDNNENFKTNNNNNNNDLFIRGVEIFTEQQQQKQKENCENSEGGSSGGGDGDGGNSTTQSSAYVPSELKIQLNDCCECIRDIYEKRKRENLKMFFNDDENVANHEHSERTTNFLTVNKKSASERELLKKTGIWIKENILRNPSPRTRQVINITMNNKKNLNDK